MLFQGESQMAPEDHLKSLPWLARCFERVGEASMKNAVGSCCASWIPMGAATGRTRDPKMFFLCGCEWLHLIHTLLEGLEGHLTSMFLFLKCFSSLYENWYMNTVVTVSTYQIGTQCCLNLLLCARSSFLQVLEPFRAKCG